jgi:hypothetical protein
MARGEAMSDHEFLSSQLARLLSAEPSEESERAMGALDGALWVSMENETDAARDRDREVEEMSLAKDWTSADQDRAVTEGWAVFNLPEDGEIQKDDDEEKFTYDDDAILFIVNKALAGSVFHARALAIHFETVCRQRKRPQHQKGW